MNMSKLPKNAVLFTRPEGIPRRRNDLKSLQRSDILVLSPTRLPELCTQLQQAKLSVDIILDDGVTLTAYQEVALHEYQTKASKFTRVHD